MKAAEQGRDLGRVEHGGLHQVGGGLARHQAGVRLDEQFDLLGRQLKRPGSGRSAGRRLAWTSGLHPHQSVST